MLFGCQKSREIKNPLRLHVNVMDSLRLHVNVMEFQFHEKKIKNLIKKFFFP